jgi:hypothetical protein
MADEMTVEAQAGKVFQPEQGHTQQRQHEAVPDMVLSNRGRCHRRLSAKRVS